MPNVTHSFVDSPVGTITLIKTDGVLSGLYMDKHRHGPDTVPGERVQVGFEAEAEQLAEYFVGQRKRFTVKLAPEGTVFQRSVWNRLLEIPFGETWSYKDLAIAVGDVKATRAVGLANGKNPISIIIPCHRVISANGALTGYGGGLERKQFLLEHERPGLPLFG